MNHMRSVADHSDHILSAVRPVPARELPLADALGRVLAADMPARLAVPPFTNSAMDGYAVLASDVAAASPDSPVMLRVLGDQPAGYATAPEIAPGTAVRVMTGAPLPGVASSSTGASDLAIVPVEDTDQPVVPGAPLPREVQVRAAPSPGRHVRRAGDDVAVGDVIARAGTVLSARDLSALASVGYATVPAHPRLRVGIVATGDELVEPGEAPGPGQIPDSNSVLVEGLLRTLGAEPVLLPRSDDSADGLRATLTRALEGAGGPGGPAADTASTAGTAGTAGAGNSRAASVDAIVTTGGVSAGAFDVVKEVLAPLGEVEFVKVAMQPGKPQGFGVLGGSVPIFCLPGNPVSVFVSFQVFVAPALARMAARFDWAPEKFAALAAESWWSAEGREQYVPVVLDAASAEDAATGGEVRVRRATPGGSGSHLIGSLGLAQALAVVPADVDEVREGDRLRVMMAL